MCTCVCDKFSQPLYNWKSLFSLCSLKVCSAFFFFQPNKDISLLSLSLALFLVTNLLSPYLYSTYIVSFFLWLLLSFFVCFSQVLSRLIIICIEVVFFMHIIPQTYEFFNLYSYNFHWILNTFRCYFLKKLISPTLQLLFCDSNYMYIRLLKIAPQLTNAFSLLFWIPLL